MVQKKNIIDGFDTYAKSKKTSATALKWCLIFSFAVIISVLFWAFSVSVTAIEKVVVVDRSGEYLKIATDSNEKLFQALIKSTCEKATHYANTFDRLNIWENQAKAAFYADKDILQRIFVKYQTDAAYHDALENGTVYKCELEEVQEIKGINEPFEVTYTSILNVYYGTNITRYRIHSTGMLIKTTVQYPDNVTGFFFKSLNQKVEKLQ